MAKRPVKTKNRAKLTKVIEDAANSAADEALNQLNFGEDDNYQIPSDEADRNYIDREVASESYDAEVDVFEYTFKECQKKNDIPRYWIYKNSEFIGIKDHPYSMERLQKEHGGGLYKISGRSRKTGQVIKVQSEMIAEEAKPEELSEEQPSYQQNPFEMIAHMDRVRQDSRREAESASQQQTSTLAAMMAALTSSQQSQMQQMQMMMIENSKLAQAQIQAAQASAQKSSENTMNLLITLLTKKDEGPKGLGPLELIKLLEETRKSGREEQRSQDERFEKRMAQLREELEDAKGDSDSEGKESLTQSLIKGFIPILAGMQQQQAHAQGLALTPEQQQAQIVEQNRLQLEEQKRQDEVNNKRQRDISARKVAQANGAAGAPRVVQAVPTQAAAAPKQEEAVTTNVREKVQAGIFDYVKMDLAEALVNSKDASKTAGECLEKLAKVNVTRQNVVDAFTLQDFFRIAELNGVPLNLAKGWLEEFYNALRSPPDVSNNAPRDVSAAPAAGQPRVVKPRAQPIQPAKNI